MCYCENHNIHFGKVKISKSTSALDKNPRTFRIARIDPSRQGVMTLVKNKKTLTTIFWGFVGTDFFWFSGHVFETCFDLFLIVFWAHGPICQIWSEKCQLFFPEPFLTSKYGMKKVQASGGSDFWKMTSLFSCWWFLWVFGLPKHGMKKVQASGGSDFWKMAIQFQFEPRTLPNHYDDCQRSSGHSLNFSHVNRSWGW